MGKATIGLRAAALVSVAAMTLAACGGGGSDDGGNDTATGGGDGKPVKGGTLTFLTLQDQFSHMDPQRNYTGEDLAFASGYLNRTLTSFKLSTDEKEANTLVPDLATDTGTPSEDAKSWQFTIRDGVKWEDGSPVTCEDVKYGVSRTFATDLITDGPQYAVAYLDIPKDKEGASVYKGPYATKGSDTAAFDKAVTCEGSTITFNLSLPVPDFNQTVTLSAFAPVPEAADTGEKYDDKVMSSGPYKIAEYSKGSQLVLDRNENWDPETDEYRGAYPDKIVVKFGLDPSVIDQRLIQDSGADQQTTTFGDSVQSANLATVFKDDRFKDRRADEFDAYSYYYAVNVSKLPNIKHRQAIAAALDRAQIRTIQGGSFGGDLGDGVIKPNLAADYAPSEMWTGLLGGEIADNGDPELAKKLIEESGEPMPTITFDYGDTPERNKEAASMVASLGKAGIKVKPNPIEVSQYYATVFDPEKANEIMWAGWGPDWPNASTVIPELFTPAGGFNLSQVKDKAYADKVQEAKTNTDRAAQSEQWKALNKEAMQNVWAIPTLFGRSQSLAGSKVKAASGDGGKPYLWAPFSSWSYADLYVEK
jgi:peptide/nickel transport system substrate-binding protein